MRRISKGRRKSGDSILSTIVSDGVELESNWTGMEAYRRFKDRTLSIWDADKGKVFGD